MKLKLNELLLSLMITIIILIVLEIVVTTTAQIVGLERFRPPFSVLITLFLAFRVKSPVLAIVILIVQYFHSIFSIEGWAMGTTAGVLIYIVVSYLRDVIHFSSALTTIIITQLFQIAWFLIVGSMIYMRSNSIELFIDKFWRFVPESIVISLLAPYAFGILEQIWKVRDNKSWNEGS